MWYLSSGYLNKIAKKWYTPYYTIIYSYHKT